MLRTDDLDYALPDELIAIAPQEPRDAARLLVVSRTDPNIRIDAHVRDLAEIVRPPDQRSSMAPDVMVVNATRVLPARFKGVRPDTGGQVEGLYIEPASLQHPMSNQGPLWVVLLKMRRMKPGLVVELHDRHERPCGVTLRLIERQNDADREGGGGAWVVLVESSTLALTPGLTAADLLEFVGLTPVPPYILSQRRKQQSLVSDDRDRAMYQTVYASTRQERPGHGSVAAPTAGLHFTPGLLSRLADAGVERAEVTLDVGLGTFKPVETMFIEEHQMHSEWCSVPTETATAIRRVRSDKRGRVWAIGTTSARTLESFASVEDMLKSRTKDTRLLITPGYAWKHVDMMMTNFHLPKSTLLAMIAALFVQPGQDPMAGVARLKDIYAHAVRERYRFFSYGDAMLILP